VQIIIPPTSSSECFVGLHNAFVEDFPPQLDRFMTKKSFHNAIERINDNLSAYWPCCCCFNFGNWCCLCTAGLSCLFPWQCTSAVS
jgi:hypothetical protein